MLKLVSRSAELWFVTVGFFFLAYLPNTQDQLMSQHLVDCGSTVPPSLPSSTVCTGHSSSADWPPFDIVIC